jgi:hypothetical protein
MSDQTTDKAPTFKPVKTCALCSHMKISNKGLIAECEMKGKGMHPGVRFQRLPNGEFNTFAWLKARDCAFYDGDEEEDTEAEETSQVEAGQSETS